MIYHVCQKEVWEKEKGNPLFGESEMKDYGFIHSSTKTGLKKILKRFTDTDNLLVLSIDETKIREKIVYEDKDKDHLYPHFYEKIPASAIVKTEPLNEYLQNRNTHKIIFTDIDGTVCDYENRIPASCKEAIRLAKENGHRIYMVTGRSKAENKKEIWDLGFNGMIGGNGAYIEDGDTIVYHKRLSKEETRKIVDWCEKRGLGYFEESNNGLFGSKRFFEEDGAAALRAYMKGKGTDDSMMSDEEVLALLHGLVRCDDPYRDDVNKISFVLRSHEDLAEAEKEFGELKVGSWGGMGQEALFGDVGITGSDKAEAIRILLDYLNEDIGNTIALGDADVDIPMLKYCHIGIAMGSGSQGIREAADYVTDDVDKDGFHKAFRYFGLI